MRSILFMPVCLSISACITEYKIHDNQDGPAPVIGDDISSAPIAEDSDTLVVTDSPVGTNDEGLDSDSDNTDSEITDTDTMPDTGHPKMDSDGNPLYPIPD